MKIAPKGKLTILIKVLHYGNWMICNFLNTIFKSGYSIDCDTSIMSKYTLIILGANGMLGKYIVNYFELHDEFLVIKITRNILDAATIKYNGLIKILDPYQNAIVINCIGKIPQREDNNPKSYLQINSIFPHLLSQCCRETNNKLIHITTDCVYTGSKGNYNENDEHDETNMYGLSKSLGEPDNTTIIRTSIIGEEMENKKSLLE